MTAFAVASSRARGPEGRRDACPTSWPALSFVTRRAEATGLLSCRVKPRRETSTALSRQRAAKASEHDQAAAALQADIAGRHADREVRDSGQETMTSGRAQSPKNDREEHQRRPVRQLGDPDP